MMDIRTNHHWRDVLYWHELTDKERAEFDYLEEGEGEFFRYRGQVYDLGEFMRVGEEGPLSLLGWHGYASGTFFSGVLIRFSRDCEQVQVGRYFN